MSIFHHKALLVAGIAFGLSQSALAEDKKKPELLTGANDAMISETCAGCHGDNGVSTGPATPSIAGMSSAYIVEAMEGFAKGERNSTIMGRIAKGYSADEFKQMGDYFSKQKAGTAKQDADDAAAKKGEKLHEKYCEKCHSEGGTLADDDAGILKGQWKQYLQWSLDDSLAGKREMPKKMMKKLKKLHKKEGDDGLKAVIEFYAK